MLIHEGGPLMHPVPSSSGSTSTFGVDDQFGDVASSGAVQVAPVPVPHQSQQIIGLIRDVDLQLKRAITETCPNSLTIQQASWRCDVEIEQQNPLVYYDIEKMTHSNPPEVVPAGYCPAHVYLKRELVEFARSQLSNEGRIFVAALIADGLILLSMLTPDRTYPSLVDLDCNSPDQRAQILNIKRHNNKQMLLGEPMMMDDPFSALDHLHAVGVTEDAKAQFLSALGCFLAQNHQTN